MNMTFVQTQIELLKLEAPKLELKGSWLINEIPTWEGFIEYPEPLFSISFLQYESTIHWVKSDNEKSNGHSIGFKLFRDSKESNEVQFNFSFNNSHNRIWTVVEDLNERPKVYNQFAVGQICLIAEMKGSPEIKLFAIFIPHSAVKIGRNGLWHVKDELLLGIDNDYKQILRYGRTGWFSISN